MLCILGMHTAQRGSRHLETPREASILYTIAEWCLGMPLEIGAGIGLRGCERMAASRGSCG